MLGRYWRSATDAERQQFTQSFERYMISVYWSRFSSYNGENFKVVNAQDEGNGTILVTTQILRPGERSAAGQGRPGRWRSRTVSSRSGTRASKA